MPASFGNGFCGSALRPAFNSAIISPSIVNETDRHRTCFFDVLFDPAGIHIPKGEVIVHNRVFDELLTIAWAVPVRSFQPG